jgi:hypothetical protein
LLPVGGGALLVGEDGSSSEGSIAKRRQSKCLCCGDNFTVDVRNRGHQKYCAKKACRAAGKVARQRRWLAKPENRNYRECQREPRARFTTIHNDSPYFLFLDAQGE